MTTESHPTDRTAMAVGEESAGKLTRRFGAMTDVKLAPPDLIERRVARLSSLTLSPAGPVARAEPEILIARQAAARVESEDGWPELAAHRLTGAFDGDTEQRIALATLAILDEMGLLVAAISKTGAD